MAKPPDASIYQVMNKPTNKPPPPMMTTRTPAAAADKSKVHVIPEKVACEGTTTVSIIFDAIPGPSGPVEVLLQMQDGRKKLTPTPVNERSFYFVAPENREGNCAMTVLVNGKDVASCNLSYQSETVHLVSGVAQIHLQLMSAMCRYMYALQTRHQIPSPIPDLDRVLADTFEDKDGTSHIPPRAFEEVFDILRHYPSDKIESKFELPTLLHFTAEFGLDKLTEKLMDLPGSFRASTVCNSRGLQSIQIASRNGHANLAKKLSRVNKEDAPVTRIVRPDSHNRPGTLFPRKLSEPPSRIPPVMESEYVIPGDDNYGIFPVQNPRSESSGNQKFQKPPPAPCPKSLRAHQNSGAPPVIPRRESRESRDSGAYVDGSDQTTPPAKHRERPTLTKGASEPAFTYTESSRRGSEDQTESVAPISRKFSASDIAHQLSRPVLPQSGTKGPSRTE